MKAIFITGSAAGIGRETALLFARNGWRVGLADRDEAGLADLARKIGTMASTHVMDVVNPASIAAALAAFTATTGGQLHVLHNNAGVLRIGLFEEMPLADQHLQVDINIKGVLNCLYAAFPYLQATPGAHVINMSSASATYGIPTFATYSATKHAVRAITEALDIEWERHGIRVSDLAPPFVNTHMVSSQQYRSTLVERAGVHVSPAQVAQDVWKLVQSPQLHSEVTLQLRILWPLTRAMPVRVTRNLIKRLVDL